MAGSAGAVAPRTNGPTATFYGGQVMREYKGVGPRFVAMLLDGIIIGIPAALLYTLVVMPQVSYSMYGSPDAPTWPTMLISLGSLAYMILLEAGGGTLGKRIMGMRIIDDQGNKPGLGKSLVRNLLRLVDMLPFFYIVGAIVASSSPTKQRVGDKVAKTYVVAR